jgi:hypothetical protein
MARKSLPARQYLPPEPPLLKSKELSRSRMKKSNATKATYQIEAKDSKNASIARYQ